MTWHRIPTPPKDCQQCGNTFERKVGSQSLKQFEARKFCSNSCASKWKMDNGLAIHIVQQRDPQAYKRGLQSAREANEQKRLAKIEDAEWIIGTDTPERIARRLGYADLENLRVVLRRWGRDDLAQKLMEQVA